MDESLSRPPSELAALTADDVSSVPPTRHANAAAPSRMDSDDHVFVAAPPAREGRTGGREHGGDVYWAYGELMNLREGRNKGGGGGARRGSN
eukprot:scaffold309336_cov35-Tisochrysis_lutea.AAC.1